MQEYYDHIAPKDKMTLYLLYNDKILGAKDILDDDSIVHIGPGLSAPDTVRSNSKVLFEYVILLTEFRRTLRLTW